MLYFSQTLTHSNAENMPLVYKDPSAKWADLTNVPQALWEQQHLEGLPAGTFLEMEVYASDLFNLRFRRPSQNGYSNDIFFEYRTSGKTMEFWAAGVDSRGGNIAAAVHRNVLKVVEDLGVTSISVQAGATVGPYLWARAGFKPNDGEWEDLLRGPISRRFEDLLPKHRDAISPTSVTTIRKALRNDDPRALWTIADIRDRIGPDTLGARLTVKLSWNGTCDLTDPHCAARFRAFAHQQPIPTWTPPDLSLGAKIQRIFRQLTGWRKPDPTAQLLAELHRLQSRSPS